MAGIVYDQSLVPVFNALWRQRQAIFAVGQRLVNRFVATQPRGIFEVLDYDSTLELLDDKGKEAVFRRRQKVRFPHPTNKLPPMRRRVGEIGSQSLTRCTFFSDAGFAC